jgi:NAD(P)H dehydrogenase (quinone)
MGCSHSSTAVGKTEAGLGAVVGGASVRGSVKAVVLFYSTYGHCFEMAKAVCEGAAKGGATVELRRIAETLPTDVLEKMHAVDAQKAFAGVPFAAVAELQEFDAIILVTPTRFGSAPTQVKTFLDSAGQLWLTGALVGKVGSAIVSTATQHGGQETTFRGLRNFFLHQGMIVVGLPYAYQGQMGLDEIKGGSPYGATTITGVQGERLPSAVELEGARFQGAHVAALAAKLVS